MSERTLCIIKPNAVAKQVVGAVIQRFEENDLKIVGIKGVRLAYDDARAFYAVHKERPFFDSLVEFMCSGPVVVMVLEGAQAVRKNREIMGATNPAEAAAGTLRKDFGDSIEANAVHGSDSAETAQQEIAFFFATRELLSVPT